MLHFRIVANAPQKSVRDAGCAAASAGDFGSTLRFNRHAEELRGPLHDRGELVLIVKLQLVDDPEARAKRVGERARACGGADQGEGREVELDRARRRSFADHDVDLIVLERRVEDFLHNGREAMNLVDEEHVVLFKIREDCREVARSLEHRARGLPEIHAHFSGDDVGERRFAETGRSEKKKVIERLPAAAGGFDEDLKLLAHGALADVVGELRRTERPVDVLFVGVCAGAFDDAGIRVGHG